MYKVEIHFLQVPEVLLNGNAVNFPYKKAEALLYYLAVEKHVSREQAAALLWEDADDESSRKNLRHAIYMLKKTFGFELVVSEQHFNLSLNPEISITTDINSFVEQEDVSLYKGDFLSGFFVKNSESYEEWLEHWREYYRNIYLSRLYREIAETPDRELSKLEEACSRYWLMDPYDERVSGRLMKAYRKNGLYLKAIDVYQRLYHLLEKEMGIVPGQEVTRLYREIRLEWVDTAAEEKETSLIPGREKEVQQIRKLVEEACSGAVETVVVSGEYGAGKSELIQKVTSSIEESTVLKINVSCYFSDRHIPLAIWNSAVMQLDEYIRSSRLQIPKAVLQAVAQFFPTFGNENVDVPLPIDMASSFNIRAVQNGIFQIIQMLAENHTVVLNINNIHYADVYSRRLLLMLAEGIRQHMLITMTALDVVSEELGNFFDVLEAKGKFTRIVLKPAPVDVKNQMSEKASLGECLRGLNTKSRKLLDIISLFNDYAVLELLEHVSGMDTLNVVEAVEELELRSLIGEQMVQKEIRLFFKQKKLQQYVASEITPTKRRVLHNKIGFAMEAHFSGERRGYYHQMVYHFSKGSNVPKTLQYQICPYEEISISMFELYPTMTKDFEETLPADMGTYFKDLALQLKKARNQFEEGGLYQELSARLLITTGRYEILTGQYGEGVRDVKAALEHLYVQSHPAYYIKACREMIYYGIQLYEPKVMWIYLNKSLSLAKKHDLWTEEAILKRLQGLYYIMTCQYDTAEKVLGTAIDLFERYGENDQGTVLNEAAVYNYMGELARARQQYTEAIYHFQYAVSVCTEHNIAASSTFYTNLGCVYYEMGQLEDAWKMFLKASELYDNSFTLMGRTTAKVYCSLHYCQMGDFEKSRKAMQEGMDACRQLGSPKEKYILRKMQAKLLATHPEQYKEILRESADFYLRDSVRIKAEMEAHIQEAIRDQQAE
nr:AAA family ATPase [uncultured Blautia sp.]